MPVYVKKVESTNKYFGGRVIVITGTPLDGELFQSEIPVPDDVVLCNGCNKNLFPDPVFMVFLGKRELQQNRPYDCYCQECVESYFPKAIDVGDAKSEQREAIQ